MLDLERTIERRFPHWFQGHRARLARPLVRSLAKVSRPDQIEGFRRAHGHPRGFAVVDADLAQVEPKKRERYLEHRSRSAARPQPEARP